FTQCNPPARAFLRGARLFWRHVMASVAQPRVRAYWSHDRTFLFWLSSVLLAEIPAARPASRVQFLDAARGLAIVLVVIGHVVARGLPEGNDWYGYLKEMIYGFHMP